MVKLLHVSVVLETMRKSHNAEKPHKLTQRLKVFPLFGIAKQEETGYYAINLLSSLHITIVFEDLQAYQK